MRPKLIVIQFSGLSTLNLLKRDWRAQLALVRPDGQREPSALAHFEADSEHVELYSLNATMKRSQKATMLRLETETILREWSQCDRQRAEIDDDPAHWTVNLVIELVEVFRGVRKSPWDDPERFSELPIPMKPRKCEVCPKMVDREASPHATACSDICDQESQTQMHLEEFLKAGSAVHEFRCMPLPNHISKDTLVRGKRAIEFAIRHGCYPSGDIGKMRTLRNTMDLLTTAIESIEEAKELLAALRGKPLEDWERNL